MTFEINIDDEMVCASVCKKVTSTITRDKQTTQYLEDLLRDYMTKTVTNYVHSNAIRSMIEREVRKQVTERFERKQFINGNSNDIDEKSFMEGVMFSYFSIEKLGVNESDKEAIESRIIRCAGESLANSIRKDYPCYSRIAEIIQKRG